MTTYNAGQTFKAANVPAPYPQSQVATADVTVTNTTMTDLTGASITITTRTAAATVLVLGAFDIEVISTAAVDATGNCYVDGVGQSSQAIASLTTVGQRDTKFQSWTVTLSGAGSHTIKLRGALSGSSGSATFHATHTKLSIVVFDF